MRSASELIAGALAYTHLETKADKIYYDPLTGIYNRRFFDENGARMFARKLPASVWMLGINNEKNGPAKRVTISIGVTTGKAVHTRSADDYIRRADEMLYESKKGGRNRYTFASL